MARSASLSVTRIAAALIGTALLAAGVVALWPAPKSLPKPAPTPRPVAAKLAPPTDPALYPIRSALTIDHKMKHGEWIWNEARAPLGGPAGNVMLVTIDLKAQMMSVFRGGHEIGVAVIAHGASEKPTPLGAFTVTQKSRDHVSSIYGAPMPYAMRLTDDGIFIHGTNVRIEWGTNGCVGIPNDFAKKLFAAMPMGGRVVITNGAVMQVGNSVPVV